MHRAVLIVIGDADQIGMLAAPDHPTRLGHPARTAVEDGIDQATAVHEHQRTGARHRLACARRFRLHAAVHLTRHRGLHIPGTTATALFQGIGARGHGLGLQGSQGPAVGHFAADNTGEIGLNAQAVDHPQGAAAAADAQHTPVATPSQPDAPWIVVLHRHQGAGGQPHRSAIHSGAQAGPLKAELQPLWPSLAAGESLHPQRQCTIGAQADPVALLQQHAHLRLAAAGQRYR